MAKGKHAPAKGAVRKDKVIHPSSRKFKKTQSKELRKLKIETQSKVGAVRLQALGEKLLWFQDSLNVALEDSLEINPNLILDMVEAYLNRFEDELKQIQLKSEIGKSRAFQHSSRRDAIELTKKIEAEEFEGCGLEIPDLLDPENLEYFKEWNGELRYIQNIKVKRFNRKSLQPKAEEKVDLMDV